MIIFRCGNCTSDEGNETSSVTLSLEKEKGDIPWDFNGRLSIWFDGEVRPLDSDNINILI